jgi:hypothetical protein
MIEVCRLRTPTSPKSSNISRRRIRASYCTHAPALKMCDPHQAPAFTLDARNRPLIKSYYPVTGPRRRRGATDVPICGAYQLCLSAQSPSRRQRSAASR